MTQNIFKDHILTEVHLKQDNYNLDIWDFKDPTSEYHHRVKFINSCGVLTVTGDFGNWVFCREFHPSAEGKVSRSYWDEKLRTSSQQTSSRYNPDITLHLIKEFKNNREELSEETLEWLVSLEYFVHDQVDYEHEAFRNCPKNIDYEDIPYGKTRYCWLDLIYDAFDEICNRYKTNKNENNQ